MMAGVEALQDIRSQDLSSSYKDEGAMAMTITISVGAVASPMILKSISARRRPLQQRCLQP